MEGRTWIESRIFRTLRKHFSFDTIHSKENVVYTFISPNALLIESNAVGRCRRSKGGFTGKERKDRVSDNNLKTEMNCP